MRTLKIYLLLAIAGAGISPLSAQNLLAANWENTGKSESAVATTEEKSSYQWEFTSAVPSHFDESTLQQAEKDEFGQRIACLKVLMEKQYIYKEEIVPGDPMMRTIIRKPNIYNTTRKIEKHLKKEVKKGNMELQKAVNELSYILEVAIAAIEEENIGSFETSLSEEKDNAAAQINVFKRVKLNNIY